VLKYHYWTTAGAPVAFQDWCGENHPISRPDDGGSEAPEARSAGAPRGVRSGEGRRSPSPVWGLGLCPRKIFKKINVEIAHFQAFLQAKN